MTVELDGWTRTSFKSAAIEREVFRKGAGPAVVIVHEIPGITPAVLRFAEEVVERGFTVAMPNLVGTPGRGVSGRYLAASMAKVCVAREFTVLATGKTSPIIGWLRALARSLHAEVGGRGTGAVGMCFSGGFALGMMLDDTMIAPVLSQPSLPFAVGKKRGSDLNLSPADAAVIADRASQGCEVLGLRFSADPLVGGRFDSLRELLGANFIAVELASSNKKDHSVLTEQRDDESVRRVLDFLATKLL